MLWAFWVRKTAQSGVLSWWREIFCQQLKVLMAHAEWLPGVQLRHSVPPVQDTEGWWLSGCHDSVAEHWRLKPDASWVWPPATAGLFIFVSSKFIFSSMRRDALRIQSDQCSSAKSVSAPIYSYFSYSSAFLQSLQFLAAVTTSPCYTTSHQEDFFLLTVPGILYQ